MGYLRFQKASKWLYVIFRISGIITAAVVFVIFALVVVFAVTNDIPATAERLSSGTPINVHIVNTPTVTTADLSRSVIIIILLTFALNPALLTIIFYIAGSVCKDMKSGSTPFTPNNARRTKLLLKPMLFLLLSQIFTKNIIISSLVFQRFFVTLSDMTPLFFTILLYALTQILSYIFEHGRILQEQYDETL